MSDTTGYDEAVLTEPPRNGTEIDTLVGSLERGRRYLAWKCGGLDAAAMQTTLGPSSLTLGGLLKHLAYMEDVNFSVALHGRERAQPWRGVDWTAEPDWAFRTAANDSPVELMTLWTASVARAREDIDSAARAGGPGFRTTYDGRTYSLRRILADMVEEYLRHVGHADLIRESIDGLVGEDPDD